MIYQQELIRHTTQNIFLVDEWSCCKKLIWFRESGGVTVRSQRTNDDRRGRYRSFRWWDNVCWNNVKTGSGLTRLSLKNTMEYIERWFKNKVQSSIPWWNYHTKDKVSKKNIVLWTGKSSVICSCATADYISENVQKGERDG